MSEIQVIEAFGTDEPKSMSEVASGLGVTLGTLTASVNRLVHKGVVSRYRPEEDRRVVLVTLTEEGRVAHSIHERFHRRMIDGILKDLVDESQDASIMAAEKLYVFFERVMPEDLLLENGAKS